MPRFAKFCWIWVALAALAGCAGPGTSPPAPSGPVDAVALKTHAAGWPIEGASFAFAGTVRQTTVVGGVTTHVSQSVAQKIRTTAETVRHRPVTDYRGTETDTGSGPPVKTTFDLYVAQVASKTRKGSDIWLLYATADSNGTQATTAPDAGNGIFDQLPEVPQARWTNTAARMQDVAGAGVSIADRYAADGSYDESAIFSGGAKASLQSYGDGNAVYQWPYGDAPRNSTITFSPPSRRRIQIEFTDVTGFPVTEVFTVKTWYPSAPPVLAGDAFVDVGSADVPAACKLPAKFGKRATKLVENATRLDVVFGEYETLARTTYVTPPYGVVCLTLHDDVQTHYDYTTLQFSKATRSEATYDETLGLRTAHVPNGSSSVALPLDVRASLVRAQQRSVTAQAIFDSLHLVRKNGQ
ncbi:MAG TPA: hypothetical protein VIJ77_00085 [Candidatus Tumulicola sp.]